MKVLYALQVIAFLAFQAPAFALFQAEDHPVIMPMPRSQMVPAQSQVKNYASFAFSVKKGRGAENVEKKRTDQDLGAQPPEG